MDVVDADGQKVGTVEDVRLADAGATTGGDSESDSTRARLAEAFGLESSLTEEARGRLARLGYLRVDVDGLFAGRRYVEPEQIDEVRGDQVYLSVRVDELLR